jgi:hypothetical protein
MDRTNAAVRRWSRALLVAGALAGVPARAGAQERGSVDHETARRNGEVAAQRGDFAACVEAYGRARGLAPDKDRAALAAGEAGLCEESRGRSAEAYDLLRLAQEQEPGPGGGGGRGPWKRFADAIERLERRVARVLVVVSPPGAEVFLDGARLGNDRSGRYVTVAPGQHTWKARLAGHVEVMLTHTARGGDYPDVRLTLSALPPSAQPCDEACRAAMREAGERIGEARARAEMEAVMQRQVEAAVELVYGRRVDPSLSLIAGGLLSVGLTLDAGPGFFLGGEARWRKFDEVGFSLGLEVQTLLPGKVYTLSNGANATVTQIVVAAVPCVQYKWLSGCVFGDVGMLIGGSDRPVGFPDGGILVTAGFGPRLAVQFPFAERFMVRAFSELRVSPIDTGFFDIYTPEARWGNPLVTGLFGLGLSFGEPVR